MNKLADVERLSTGDGVSIDQLIALCSDRDEEVRFRAIEALGNLPMTSKSIRAIKGAVTDPDDLVRTAAVEVFGNCEIEDAEELLLTALTDESELVRTAAIVSLGSLGSKTSIWTLEQRFRATANKNADTLSCAIALYTLGRSSYLKEALSFLTHDSYQLRCAAANLLGAFTETKDISMVLARLRSALEKEKTNAARSSMRGAIEQLAPM